MASLLRQIIDGLSERLDEDLLPSLYTAASLSTDQVRHELMGLGLVWHEPGSGREPPEEELEAAADELIRRAMSRAAVRGAVGGAGGAVAIPPEIAASVVQTLRLGQRLAVLYGFVLESDRGRLMLSRALAAAYGLELPQQRAVGGVKISDLPQVARTQLPDVQRTGAWVARAIGWRVARTVGGRFSRILPGVGAGVGAWDARRTLRSQAAQMRAVYRRAWDGGCRLDASTIIDAVEIPDP